MTSPAAAALFADLPDSARLWVFGLGRELSPGDESRLTGDVAAFLGGWRAHGQPLVARVESVYRRFLLVAVDEGVGTPTGCSIDALVTRLRALEAELETEIVGSSPVWYRPEGEGAAIERVSRSVFRARAEAGLVTGETIVFDLSLERVGGLREGRWERPVRESWHRRYLARATPRAPALS